MSETVEVADTDSELVLLRKQVASLSGKLEAEKKKKSAPGEEGPELGVGISQERA